MKIGLMSDSHDHIDNVKKCVQIFQDKSVEFVVHLGDFVNPNSVRALKGIKLSAIFGNNDGDKYRMIVAFNEIGAEIKGDFHDFKLDNITFACYHGTEPQLLTALIECGKYDVVLFGHTHECVRNKVGKTEVLNPGTVHGFGGRATIMIYDTEKRLAEIIAV